MNFKKSNTFFLKIFLFDKFLKKYKIKKMVDVSEKFICPPFRVLVEFFERVSNESKATHKRRLLEIIFKNWKSDNYVFKKITL